MCVSKFLRKQIWCKSLFDQQDRQLGSTELFALGLRHLHRHLHRQQVLQVQEVGQHMERRRLMQLLSFLLNSQFWLLEPLL